MPMVENGHKIKIDLSPDKIGTLVYLDGVIVKELVCVEVRHHAGEVSRIKLELLPSAVEISGDAGEVHRVECSLEDARRARMDEIPDWRVEARRESRARFLDQTVEPYAATEGQ